MPTFHTLLRPPETPSRVVSSPEHVRVQHYSHRATNAVKHPPLLRFSCFLLSPYLIILHILCLQRQNKRFYRITVSI
jgi:hypothetical protein